MIQLTEIEIATYSYLFGERLSQLRHVNLLKRFLNSLAESCFWSVLQFLEFLTGTPGRCAHIAQHDHCSRSSIKVRSTKFLYPAFNDIVRWHNDNSGFGVVTS